MLLNLVNNIFAVRILRVCRENIQEASVVEHRVVNVAVSGKGRVVKLQGRSCRASNAAIRCVALSRAFQLALLVEGTLEMFGCIAWGYCLLSVLGHFQTNAGPAQQLNSTSRQRHQPNTTKCSMRRGTTNCAGINI